MAPSKKFHLSLLAALAALLLATPTRSDAFGGPPGGPFGNGSNFPNDGTFSAVLRGPNLSGTLQFSTTSDSGPSNQATTQSSTVDLSQLSITDSTTTSDAGGSGSTGIANIYFNGSSFRGNSQGSIDPTTSGMELTFQAEAKGQGNGTIVVSRRYTSSSTTNGTTTTTQTTLPVSTVAYYDSKTMNGYAQCKTSNAFPNQKLKGKGEVVVQELDFNSGNSNPEVSTSEPIGISVTGVRLSNTAGSFKTETITAPSVVNTTILTNPN